MNIIISYSCLLFTVSHIFVLVFQIRLPIIDQSCGPRSDHARVQRIRPQSRQMFEISLIRYTTYCTFQIKTEGDSE